MMKQPKSDEQASWECRIEQSETPRDEMVANIWYSKRRDDRLSVQSIAVELVDVRAASGLVIRYDFERDGWAIFQVRESGDGEHGVEVETAFLPAWPFEDE